MFAGFGTFALILALGFGVRNRPSRQETLIKNKPSNELTKTERARRGGALVWSLLSSVALTEFLVSDYVGVSLLAGDPPIVPRLTKATFLMVGSVTGALIYAIASIMAWPERKDLRDFVAWSSSGLVYGAIIAIGLYVWIHPIQVASA